MNPKLIHTASLILACAGMSAAASNARAEYRCDKPQSFIDVKACAKAKEGPRALQQFIYRTRMVYGLYFWDYVRPEESR